MDLLLFPVTGETIDHETELALKNRLVLQAAVIAGRPG
jgi:hypothetical protein